MPKRDIDSEIQARVETFASELTTLVREAALESVQDAIRASGTATAPAPRRAGRRKARRKVARRKGARRKGGRRVRRSEEEIAALADQVLAYVRSNPGSRLEEISAGLDIASAELKRPVANLLAAKALKTTGQKRGTKYHPAGGRRAKAGATRKKKKKSTRRKASRKKRTTRKRKSAAK